MAQVLVVEDEPAIAESVAYALGRAKFEAATASSLEQARRHLEESEVSLVVLDLMLPDGSGFELIEELAARSAAPAIIVLSSRDGEADRVKALEGGADDYVIKPFSPREIVARVKAVLRRAHPEASATIPSPLLIDPSTRKAHVFGQVLELTRVEFDLLMLLMKRPGVVLSRAAIIDEVWGHRFALSDRTIDSHIKALRKKLTDAGGSGSWIETVRGIGYRMAQPEQEA